MVFRKPPIRSPGPGDNIPKLTPSPATPEALRPRHIHGGLFFGYPYGYPKLFILTLMWTFIHHGITNPPRLLYGISKKSMSSTFASSLSISWPWISHEKSSQWSPIETPGPPTGHLGKELRIAIYLSYPGERFCLVGGWATYSHCRPVSRRSATPGG